MRLLTGDECGLIKEYDPISRTKLIPSSLSTPAKAGDGEVLRFNPNDHADRRRGVIDMAWTASSSLQSSFAALALDGRVQFWTRDMHGQGGSREISHRRTAELVGVFDERDEQPTRISHLSRPLALANLGDTRRGLLCAANASGTVALINPGNGETVGTRPADDAMHSPSVVTSFPTFNSSQPHHSNRKYDKAEYPLLSAIGVHRRNGWVAVGGKDRDTAVFDVETQKQVWKAKNLPPDPQTLLQPLVWPTSILYLDYFPHQSTEIGNESNVVGVGTAHHQVRIYDVRANSTNRRPQSYSPDGILEHKVTALCQLDVNTLVAGDAAGGLVSLDLRTFTSSSRRGNPKLPPTPAQSQTRFMGPAGSIRQLVKHSSEPIIAAVGLDRMLRIYHTTTRKQLRCVYLKQRLNCVLLREEGSDAQLWETCAEALDAARAAGDAGPDGETVAPMEQRDVVEDYVDSDANESFASERSSSNTSSSDENSVSESEHDYDDAENRRSFKKTRR